MAKSIISTEVNVESKIVTTLQQLQQSIEEAQPSRSTDVRDALRVRNPKKKKRKKKKKKRVPRSIFYYDSDEGSEEYVVD